MKITAINSYQSKIHNNSVTKSIQAPAVLNSETNLKNMPVYNYNISFGSRPRPMALPSPIRPLTELKALQLGYMCVYDKEDLQEALMNNKKTILMADIDFGNAERKTAKIGNWTTVPEFSNELNGNGHKIKNLKNGLYRCGLEEDKGLFYKLDNAKIENLIIEDAYIMSKNKKPGNAAATGIIAGVMKNSAIENCAVGGKILTESKYTGLIAGQAEDSVFDNVSIAGSIKTIPSKLKLQYFNEWVPAEDTRLPDYFKDADYMGALAGDIDNCIVKNCVAKAKIKGWDYAGGVIGQASGSVFEHCRYTTEVNAKSYAGGCVGLVTDCDFEDCKGVANVRARVPEKARFIGSFFGHIDDDTRSLTHFLNCSLNK